jgi:exopolyphosphatase/guanosine-5'-triphosphate,3'-diphosphate pyrophosphatase
MIFDDLTILHGLSDETREMLKAASLLHDIGWSIPTMPHHKASRDIILKDTAMRLSSNERMIIAMIVRYHRKSHPKPSHAIYKELCINDQMIVSWCAGIVRIADALDRAHQKQVKTVHCIVSPEDILISCTCTVTLHIDETVFSERASCWRNLPIAGFVLYATEKSKNCRIS